MNLYAVLLNPQVEASAKHAPEPHNQENSSKTQQINRPDFTQIPSREKHRSDSQERDTFKNRRELQYFRLFVGC